MEGAGSCDLFWYDLGPAIRIFRAVDNIRNLVYSNARPVRRPIMLVEEFMQSPFKRALFCLVVTSIGVTTACGDDGIELEESPETSPACGKNARLSAEDVCVCWSGYEYCELDEPESGCCEIEEPDELWDPYCADGICNGQETPANCPRDCTDDVFCGDGRCQPGETPTNCSQDCVDEGICGDGVCGGDETTANCTTDCETANTCGDGVCTPGESSRTCPADCESTSFRCGDGICDGTETQTNCARDCATERVCGDGVCEPAELDACASDCGSACNGECLPYDLDICPADCPGVVCRDGVCELGESPTVCSVDCFAADPAYTGEDGPTPEVVIFAVSGHCFNGCPGGSVFGADAVNPEYMEESRGIEQIADRFRDDGFIVDVWYYADEFYDRTEDGGEYYPSRVGILPDHYGFLSLLLDMAATRDRLFDYEAEERPLIILAAHSHGTVWAHSAAMLMPDFEIDLLIDLDSESILWPAAVGLAGDDWSSVIQDYEETNFVAFPMRDQSWFLGVATNYFDIPSVAAAYDIEDVVPNNVWINLEVAADVVLVDASFARIQDSERNYRLNGTQTDVFQYEATGLGHGGVHRTGSHSIDWVIEQIIAGLGRLGG